MSLSDVHGCMSWVMLMFHRIRFNCYIIRVVALHCQSFTLHVDDMVMLNWELKSVALIWSTLMWHVLIDCILTVCNI